MTFYHEVIKMMPVVHLSYQILILADYAFKVYDVYSKVGEVLSPCELFAYKPEENELVKVKMRVLHFQVQFEEVGY